MKSVKYTLPSLTVILTNLAVVSYKYATLPRVLPLHFDLEGNASSTMPSSTLFIYPAVALCLAALVLLLVLFLGRKRSGDARGWEWGWSALSFCISLVVLSSTFVTLTFGTQPFFMLAEPVLLAIGIVCVAISEIRYHKTCREQ